MTSIGNLWETIQRAALSTWLYEGFAEQYLADIQKKWGDLDVQILKNIVLESDGDEKVFAIYALGYLAPSDFLSTIAPFLFADEMTVRWAATIVCGRYQQPQALPALYTILSESIENYPYNAELEEIIFSAIAASAQWRDEVLASHVHDWDYLMQQREQYEHLVRMKYEVIDIICSYEQENTLEAFENALAKCHLLEYSIPAISKSEWSPYQYLLDVQKYLAFACGYLLARKNIFYHYRQAKTFFSLFNNVPAKQRLLTAYFLHGSVHKHYPHQPYAEILEANIITCMNNTRFAHVYEKQSGWSRIEQAAFIHQLTIDIEEVRPFSLSVAESPNSEYLGDLEDFPL